MAGMSPQDIAAKWSRNLGAAAASIQAGVQAVTVSPMQKAAAQVSQYVAGVQQAAASGKWVRGLNRRTLQDWQQSVITKGIPRITAGATAGQPKMTSFMSKWMPHMDALKSKLASQPRGDLQTNIQRAITAIQHNASFVHQ